MMILAMTTLMKTNNNIYSLSFIMHIDSAIFIHLFTCYPPFFFLNFRINLVIWLRRERARKKKKKSSIVIVIKSSLFIIIKLILKSLMFSTVTTVVILLMCYRFFQTFYKLLLQNCFLQVFTLSNAYDVYRQLACFVIK